MHSSYRSSTRGPEDDSVESKHVAPLSHYMFNFTTVVFDGTSPAFYFTDTSGWNTSSSKFDTRSLQTDMINAHIFFFVQPEFVPHRKRHLSYEE